MDKLCRKCNQLKPATSEYFPKHNKTTSGITTPCRDCHSLQRKQNLRGIYRNAISDEALIDLRETITECIICGDNCRLDVDHDHATGKIRGLLCSRCNRGIGFFKDNPEILLKARDYLEKSGQPY